MFPRRFIAKLVFLGLMAGIWTAPAATRVWTGATSMYWTNPANWTNGIKPAPGDSIEFPDSAIRRDTHNDLFVAFDLDTITFTGRNYHLRGESINLHGGLISVPGNSTNRISVNLGIVSPLSIINYGYLNALVLAGDIRLYAPLTLETGSSFVLTARILDTNNFGVNLGAGGTLIMEERSQIIGRTTVDYGQLIIRDFAVGFPVRVPIEGELIIGNESGPPGQARVILQGSGRIGNGVPVTVHPTGVLRLDGSQLPQGLTETIGPLSGSGAVELAAGTLNVNLSGADTSFAGEVRGAGEFQLQGGDHTLDLGGHSGFTGSIHVWSGTLNLTGSVSNAVVRLDDLSGNQRAILIGNGTARNLITSNAVVRPGPGTLRILEHLSLHAASKLALALDGPAAGTVAADSVDLGGATLELAYLGSGPESLFTLITANANAGSTFAGLAEAGWIVAGDPAGASEFRLTYAGNLGHDVVLERGGLFVPPTLSIRRLPAHAREIAWPVSAQGYTLQQTDSLSSPQWTADGLPTPDATASEFFVIDSAVAGGRYYRLVR